ncbi:MAG: NAD-dependent epimerase/dehydratase family protein [Halobacteriales archaeon]|nr:NAD-dependent epimerase/dehydratase family protein [Halobacteriales archaeon]
MHAIVIGGTRFIGRHAVEELLASGYHVTLVNRGEHENPFVGHRKVNHVQGDRNDREVLERARDRAVPDIVIDCIALVPQQVATAIDVFRGADAYVYVSSTGVYARWDLPRREGETPLEPFTSAHTVDDPTAIDPMEEWAAYGPRKAEGDRVCFAAAEDGANAMVVRPTFVYGPHDYTERLDYWIDRVNNHDHVLVPGDGDTLVHHVYVEDVASALRTVADRGTPGEAYNVGARQLLTLDQRLARIADALGVAVELVHASEREPARYDLTPADFPLVRAEPSLIATGKLASLGWDSTPHRKAISPTVEEHLSSDRTGRHHGPDREMEEAAINGLTT